GVHVVSKPPQQALDGDPDGALVIDDQNRWGHRLAGCSGGAWRELPRNRVHRCAPSTPGVAGCTLPASGRARGTVMPPAVVSAPIVPWCASIVRLAIARPSPVPFALSEKNGSKMCGKALAGTPGPLSLTVSRALPLRVVTASAISRWPAALSSS